MRKRISGVLLATLLYIPASAQIGHEVFSNPVIQATNQNASSSAADFSAYFRVNTGATYTNSGSIYWLNSNTERTFIVDGSYATGAAATDFFGNSTSGQAMEIAGTTAPVFNNLILQMAQ